MKPWLIQSGLFRQRMSGEAHGNNPNQKGIDTILSMNYMGSAEFEFGAMPASLRRIRSNAVDYRMIHVWIDKEKIAIFVNSEQQKTAHEILDNIVLGDYQLKERCSFETLILNKSKCQDDFWWDIENDWMWWKSNATVDGMLPEVIKGF